LDRENAIVVSRKGADFQAGKVWVEQQSAVFLAGRICIWSNLPEFIDTGCILGQNL